MLKCEVGTEKKVTRTKDGKSKVTRNFEDKATTYLYTELESSAWR
jgi:hypothetical protein